MDSELVLVKPMGFMGSLPIYTIGITIVTTVYILGNEEEKRENSDYLVKTGTGYKFGGSLLFLKH